MFEVTNRATAEHDSAYAADSLLPNKAACYERSRAQERVYNHKYHEKVFVSEGMSSRGWPCQHLQEPSHDPGGVALPRMHSPWHHARNHESVNTSTMVDRYRAD